MNTHINHHMYIYIIIYIYHVIALYHDGWRPNCSKLAVFAENEHPQILAILMFQHVSTHSFVYHDRHPSHPYNDSSHPIAVQGFQGSLLVRQLFPQTLVLRTHCFGILLDLRLLQFLALATVCMGITRLFSWDLVDVENGSYCVFTWCFTSTMRFSTSTYLVGVSLSLHTRFLATKSGWMLLGPRSNNTGLKRMYQETMISASNKEPVAKNLGFYIHHSCTSSGWKPMFWHSSINLTLRLNQLTHDPPHPRIPAPPPYLLSWRSNVASSIINIYMSSINLLTQLKSPKTYPRCARKSTFFRDLACRVSSETAGHSLKSTGKYMEPLHFVWEKIPRCLFFNGRDLKRMETTHDSTDSFVCTF